MRRRVILTDQQLHDRLVSWATLLTEAEKSETREAWAKWCADRESTAGPWEGIRKSMKNDLDTLALNDFDRDFLRDLGIEIPADARWEIDGGDAPESPHPEAAE